MKKFFYIGAGIIPALLLSCQKEMPLSSPSSFKPEKAILDSWNVPSYTELRTAESSLLPERYLGKGFNLLKSSFTDAGGFTDYSIVSNETTPWSPFGRPIEEENLHPIVNAYGSLDLHQELHQDLSKTTSIDSIRFSTTTTYKSNTLSYVTTDVSRNSKKSHTYNSFIYRKDKVIMYDLSDPKNLEFYLNKRFVRDLSRLSAADLISKYGTHIVTKYYIGPYIDLRVSANSSIFSAEDVKKLEAKIWDNKVNIEPTLRNKVEKNSTDISVVYRQGGSDYVPEKSLLSVAAFYKEGAIESLDIRAWEKGIRNDNSFLMLGRGEDAILPIPDLISNIPLKIKYISGILHNVFPAINYILCNPKTFQPIKLNNQYLRVALLGYNDGMNLIHLGIDGGQILTESYITSMPYKRHKWDLEQHQNGLWTIRSRASGMYLCTDKQLRAIDADSNGQRYWLLNPIIPTVDGNTRKISQLFIPLK